MSDDTTPRSSVQHFVFDGGPGRPPIGADIEIGFTNREFELIRTAHEQLITDAMEKAATIGTTVERELRYTQNFPWGGGLAVERRTRALAEMTSMHGFLARVLDPKYSPPFLDDRTRVAATIIFDALSELLASQQQSSTE